MNTTMKDIVEHVVVLYKKQITYQGEAYMIDMSPTSELQLNMLTATAVAALITSRPLGHSLMVKVLLHGKWIALSPLRDDESTLLFLKNLKRCMHGAN